MNEKMYKAGFLETCKAYGISKSAADAMYISAIEIDIGGLEKVAEDSGHLSENDMHYAGFIDTCAKYGIEKTAADELYKEAQFGWLKGLWNIGKAAYRAQKGLGTAVKALEAAKTARKGIRAAKIVNVANAERTAAGLIARGKRTGGIGGFFNRIAGSVGGAIGRVKGEGFRSLFRGFKGGWQGAGHRVGAAPKLTKAPVKAPVKPPVEPAVKPPQKPVNQPTEVTGPKAGRRGRRVKPTSEPATTSDVGGAVNAANEAAGGSKHWWNMSPVKAWGEWIGRHPRIGVTSVAVPFALAGGMAAHNPYQPEMSTVNTLTPSQRMMYDNIYGGNSMEGLGNYEGGYF